MSHIDRLAVFDCRLMQPDTQDDAVKLLEWRIQDALKNSVSMVAHSFLPHKQLLNKNSLMQKEMLSTIGIDYEAYDETLKSGFFVRKKLVQKSLTELEWNAIDNAHKPEFFRHTIDVIGVKNFKQLSNKVQFVFDVNSVPLY